MMAGPSRSFAADASLLAPARERHLAIVCFAAFAFVLAALALGRTYLDYGTESDFLGSFLPEAERIAAGEPLLLEWHPPLYPFALVLARGVTGDWVQGGLLISYLAALSVIACSFWFWRELAGRAAAWGAVLGLAGSAIFLQFAISATSDLFFLALFASGQLLALLALRTQSPLHWTGTGLLVGLAILTRSNAISLLLLAAAPFLGQARGAQKVRHLGFLLLGLALPLLLWAGYSAATGSRLAPANNHLNLAMTYFVEGPDRISVFARQQVEGRFEGVLDVLLRDPARIAAQYVVDLVNLVRLGLAELLEAPFPFVFLPGLLFLMFRCWSGRLAFFLMVSVAQVLLVNMKAFEPRFYMFLVPLFGVGVVETGRLMLASAPGPAWRRGVWGLVVLGCVAAVGLAALRAERQVARSHAELTEVVPAARGALPESATVIARKRHLGFYTGTTYQLFPNRGSLEELREFAQDLPGARPLYLFYGEQERAAVPELAALATPGAAPAWLDPIARSERPGAWVLYRCVGLD